MSFNVVENNGSSVKTQFLVLFQLRILGQLRNGHSFHSDDLCSADPTTSMASIFRSNTSRWASRHSTEGTQRTFNIPPPPRHVLAPDSVCFKAPASPRINYSRLRECTWRPQGGHSCYFFPPSANRARLGISSRRGRLRFPPTVGVRTQGRASAT